MASFITSSITWDGKENLDHFLRPMFIGKSPWDTQGVRVMSNIKSSQKLNYFGVAQKLLKAYVKGFNAANGTTYTQRTITTHRMKAEAADDANDFYQTVFEEATRVDDWNNIEGTLLKKIIAELYQNAVSSDVFRQFWLNDTTKETRDASGFPSGTADTDYNAYDGMIKMLKDDSATTPSDTQIKRVAIANGAVAQVATVTISTAASGTGNLTINGVDYLVTYNTSTTQTWTDFKTANAAALLLRGLVLSGTTTLVITAATAGDPFAAPTWAGVSGTLACTVAASTANTAPGDLAAGESEDTFLALYQGADKVLKQYPKNRKVYLVTDSVYENYETYLESLGTEISQVHLENGQEALAYRGIAVINLGWDVHMEADFAHAAGENPADPHLVIYTTIDNLVLGIDSMNQFNGTKMWYNMDEEENRFRTKLVMGAQYVHNKFTAVAY